MDPRTSLDALEKKKFFVPSGNETTIPQTFIVTTLTMQQQIFFFKKSIATEVTYAVMLHLHTDKHISTISVVVDQHV
jgi:hypothetical protein